MLDTGTESPRPHTNRYTILITASPIAAATNNVVNVASTHAAATMPVNMISIGCGLPQRFQSGSNKGIVIRPNTYNVMSGMHITLIPIRIPIIVFITIIIRLTIIFI